MQGSATTAHAVMDFNKSNESNIRYICVQLPEKLDEKTEAYKFGYRNISEIAIARIKAVADKISIDADGRDLGVKVFRLTNSNIQAWNPDRTDLEETLLSHEEHLIEGRSEQDVLYELLLKRGVDLAVPIEGREGRWQEYLQHWLWCGCLPALMNLSTANRLRI